MLCSDSVDSVQESVVVVVPLALLREVGGLGSGILGGGAGELDRCPYGRDTELI